MPPVAGHHPEDAHSERVGLCVELGLAVFRLPGVQYDSFLMQASRGPWMKIEKVHELAGRQGGEKLAGAGR